MKEDVQTTNVVGNTNSNIHRACIQNSEFKTNETADT